MIEEESNTPALRLRPATAEDAHRLLAWRNDPLTRQASHTSDPVALSDHLAWLHRVLGRSDVELYIVELDEVPSGTVRAQRVEQGHLLSWTTAPEARGRGVARRAVTMLASMHEGPLIAEVKRENIASAKVALSAGLTLDREVDGVQYFQRPALR